jgi:indole-3-glycerol phosphate synthase
MENILKKIINKKKERVHLYKKKKSEDKLLNNIKNVKGFLNFKEKIITRSNKKKISVIAEIKKASPSAGIIIKNFNHLDIAKTYFENDATCLSVLTEEDFFQGQIDFISDIKKQIKIPILCKDFFIDTYQVVLAKSYCADCILIILSALDLNQAKDIYQAANDLNISTLIEVHTQQEAETALSFENALIGINNRNLKTLEVSLKTTIELSKILNSHVNPLICESGIKSYSDLKYIVENSNIFNFLIGESILKKPNIADGLKEFTQISL